MPRASGRLPASWQAFLAELSQLFAELRLENTGRAVAEEVELATARLLPLVLERTTADDAWYGDACRVLVWYLETQGYDPAQVEPLVDATFSARFESWIEPDPSVIESTQRELGLAIAAATSNPAADSLATWLTSRAVAPAIDPRAPRPRAPAGPDAHRAFIEQERARDPARAARMSAALDACRASAARAEPPTIESLASWQAIVLGAPAPLRTTDAFARQGRVRYAYHPDLEPRFRTAIAEANSDAPAILRAARIYLDLCFFHPFPDGNARAARLALDHTLTRANLTLRTAPPLFTIARTPPPRARAPRG
ncbi:MAG: Fic family protein, partial [Deltaproteobacteria bacterium]|nr:Fic family protein [Deltaproteobacteria bacterium]